MSPADTTSQTRHDANKENAQHSTGPRTAAGKTRSSQNARKHGLTCARAHVHPDEQSFFDELYTAQQDELQPEGSSEQHLFEEIIASLWTIEKIRCYQTGLIDSDGRDGIETDDEPNRKQYDRYSRYHTRAQNTWFRCLRMLKILQKERIAKQTQAAARQQAQWTENLTSTVDEFLHQNTSHQPEDTIFDNISALAATLHPNNPGHPTRAAELFEDRLDQFLDNPDAFLK